MKAENYEQLVGIKKCDSSISRGLSTLKVSLKYVETKMQKSNQQENQYETLI